MLVLGLLQTSSLSIWSRSRPTLGHTFALDSTTSHTPPSPLLAMGRSFQEFGRRVMRLMRGGRARRIRSWQPTASSRPLPSFAPPPKFHPLPPRPSPPLVYSHQQLQPTGQSDYPQVTQSSQQVQTFSTAGPSGVHIVLGSYNFPEPAQPAPHQSPIPDLPSFSELPPRFSQTPQTVSQSFQSFSEANPTFSPIPSSFSQLPPSFSESFSDSYGSPLASPISFPPSSPPPFAPLVNASPPPGFGQTHFSSVITSPPFSEPSSKPQPLSFPTERPSLPIIFETSGQAFQTTHSSSSKETTAAPAPLKSEFPPSSVTFPILNPETSEGGNSPGKPPFDPSISAGLEIVAPFVASPGGRPNVVQKASDPAPDQENPGKYFTTDLELISAVQDRPLFYQDTGPVSREECNLRKWLRACRAYR